MLLKKHNNPITISTINKIIDEQIHPHPRRHTKEHVNMWTSPEDIQNHPNDLNIFGGLDFDERFREWTDEQFETWSKKLKTIGVYTWRHGRTVYIPKLELKSFEEYLKMTYQHGARGYYGEEYPNWGLDAPKTYITSRLLWNVEDSADALLSDFCTKSFKEAAAPMRKFYDLLERTWNEQSPYDAPIITGYMKGRREQF